MLKSLYYSQYFPNINIKILCCLKKNPTPMETLQREGENVKTNPLIQVPLLSVLNQSDTLLEAVEILKKTAYLI